MQNHPAGPRVLVCGGREFDDRDRAFAALDEHAWNVCVVIHGAAIGADTLAGEWAEARGVLVEAYPADWITHRRAAGPIRNRQMLNEGRPDLVIALPGARGTAHMVRIAREAGVRVIEVKP